MKLEPLTDELTKIKSAIDHAITTSSYGGKNHENGVEAKNALIRSSTLIQRIHDTTKASLHSALKDAGIAHRIFPPLGDRSPELDVWGSLKKKKQDVVVLNNQFPPHSELIVDGALAGEYDGLGASATEHAIVVGVRSQLSSIDKNFDTLMERAFAETINLRMRHPKLVMGEVYMLAVREYDDQAMLSCGVKWKKNFTNVGKFINIFLAMSGRKDPTDLKESFKYERSVLLLVDFSQTPVKIFKTTKELQDAGIVSANFKSAYELLSPVNFGHDIVKFYQQRHGLKV